MADSDTLKPMEPGDIAPPPATDALQPTGETAAPPATLSFDGARQTARDAAGNLGQQATDKARELAETGKAKVGGLLDQVAQMLTDAAGQVDERLGEQYGVHARSAATAVQDFAQTVRDKDVDEFAGELRGYVAKSPAVALGVAAALGFGLARMVHSGFDQRA